MNWRLILALFLITAAIGPASAQLQGGGVPTETQSRQTEADSGYDIFWNLLGLVGLVGFIGIVPRHEADSYHPSPIE